MPLKNIITFFTIIGLLLIPFNEIQVLPFLGEFRNEISILFFFISFSFIVFYSILANKIFFPFKSNLYLILLFFISWCVFSFLGNFNEISIYFFKKTSGIQRFINQFISLVISSVICFYIFWFILKNKKPKEILFFIRKIFLASFCFVSFYGFIELLISYFGFNFLKPLFEFISQLPLLKPTIHIGGRISSVSFEPPDLAIYLITTSGWMFSYILTSKSKLRFYPTIIILALTFFSGSRTALLVISLQLICFIYFLYFKFGFKKEILKICKYSILFTFSFSLIFGAKFYSAIKEKISTLSFLENLETSISNKSRLGIQYASLQTFSKNPIIGVGYGQQAFASKDYYPVWATENNYEFKLYFLNENNKSFPPGFNMYTRLLAELGFIGFLIFIFFEINVIYKLHFLINKDKDLYGNILGTVLFVSFIGLFINWLQIDSFRIYGVWLSLAILIIYIKFYEQNNSSNTTLQQ